MAVREKRGRKGKKDRKRKRPNIVSGNTRTKYTWKKRQTSQTTTFQFNYQVGISRHLDSTHLICHHSCWFRKFPKIFFKTFFRGMFFFQKRKTLPFLLFQEILRDDFLTWSIDFRLLGNLSLGIGGDDSRYVENDQHRVERSHFQRWRHQSVRAVNQVHQTSPSSSSSSSSSSHAPPQSRIRTVFLLIEFFFLSLFFSPIHRHFHFDGRNVAIKNDLMKSSWVVVQTIGANDITGVGDEKELMVNLLSLVFNYLTGVKSQGKMKVQVDRKETKVSASVYAGRSVQEIKGKK